MMARLLIEMSARTTVYSVWWVDILLAAQNIHNADVALHAASHVARRRSACMDSAHIHNPKPRTVVCMVLTDGEVCMHAWCRQC